MLTYTWKKQKWNDWKKKKKKIQGEAGKKRKRRRMNRYSTTCLWRPDCWPARRYPLSWPSAGIILFTYTTHTHTTAGLVPLIPSPPWLGQQPGIIHRAITFSLPTFEQWHQHISDLTWWTTGLTIHAYTFEKVTSFIVRCQFFIVVFITQKSVERNKFVLERETEWLFEWHCGDNIIA